MRKLSIKTTTSGVVAFIAALTTILKLINDFLTGQPITLEEITLAVGLIGAAGAGLFGRDNNVTSEEAGAK